MGVIQDIKDKFITSEIYSIYSLCMYQPTWEKFISKAAEYMNSQTTSIFGYYLDGHIAGVIVINQDQKGGEFPLIRGIAINYENRNQGIGRQLIQYACKVLGLSILTAETDDDAVSFYIRCGFKTEEFMLTFDSGEYRRYKCVLYNN